MAVVEHPGAQGLRYARKDCPRYFVKSRRGRGPVSHPVLLVGDSGADLAAAHGAAQPHPGLDR